VAEDLMNAAKKTGKKFGEFKILDLSSIAS
jgi:hypothetical protein